MSRSTLQSAYKALLKHQRLLQNPCQAALVTHLANLQADLALRNHNQGSPKGVYIYGDVGIGKSRIADLFAATLPPSISSRRIHFHEFMMDIHMRLHHAHPQAFYAGDPLIQIGRDIRNESRVLCFDEFQVTDIADAMILRRVFGAIWESGGVMVSTSNRPPEKLYENGLNRSLFLPFVDELRRRCEVWKMEGKEDYRMSSGGERRVNVFFTEAHDFERDFRGAVGGLELEAMEFPVQMGRKLRIAAAKIWDGELIVRSTFEDLCQNFLGSADYLMLCRVTKTVYLTGVRQFRAHELDFVRRFITLVDLAYESKTRIICLSSVPLFEIFSEIVPKKIRVGGQLQEDLARQMTVKREGGSSSSMMSTFIGEMEWSATGLAEASLASGGAGETDVGFAVGRAISRFLTFTRSSLINLNTSTSPSAHQHLSNYDLEVEDVRHRTNDLCLRLSGRRKDHHVVLGESRDEAEAMSLSEKIHRCEGKREVCYVHETMWKRLEEVEACGTTKAWNTESIGLGI